MATPIPANRAALEASMVAGRVVRSTGRRAVGISTDSRAVVPGGAFVAIKGGHAHQKDAVDAGAILLVAEKALDDPRADAVEVADSIAAWGDIARAHRRAWRGTVIAVTGSAGKTTTKELCAALLGSDVWATPGNLNNLIGLPATVLCLESRHRFAVLEAGMSVPGEIARLGEICEPDVAIVTNIGMAHAGGVGGTLEGVAKEKGALFEAAKHACVAPIADETAMKQLSRTRAKTILTFGRSGKADYQLLDRKPGRLRVRTPKETIDVEFPLAGEAAAIDFVAALAAVEAVGAKPDLSLRSLVMPPGRAALLRLGDVTVIDDTYNANPASMRAAFEMLSEMSGRKIAVLGEMRELGDATDPEHAALGDLVDANVIIGCGGAIDKTLERARKRGIETHAASDAKSAAAIACEIVRSGDVVLVKGSRGVATEAVVEALRSKHAV